MIYTVQPNKKMHYFFLSSSLNVIAFEHLKKDMIFNHFRVCFAIAHQILILTYQRKNLTISTRMLQLRRVLQQRIQCLGRRS